MIIPTATYNGHELRAYASQQFPPFGDPYAKGARRFSSVVRIDTIPIQRGGRTTLLDSLRRREPRHFRRRDRPCHAVRQGHRRRQGSGRGALSAGNPIPVTAVDRQNEFFEDDMYKRILVAIDGSETAEHAFDSALHLAHDNDAQLQPLYVVDNPLMDTTRTATIRRSCETPALKKASG